MAEVEKTTQRASSKSSQTVSFFPFFWPLQNLQGLRALLVRLPAHLTARRGRESPKAKDERRREEAFPKVLDSGRLFRRLFHDLPFLRPKKMKNT